MTEPDKQQLLNNQEKQIFLAEMEFSVRHIAPACGSLFPSAVDRSQEADFVLWMQNLQNKESNQTENQS